MCLYQILFQSAYRFYKSGGYAQIWEIDKWVKYGNLKYWCTDNHPTPTHAKFQLNLPSCSLNPHGYAWIEMIDW